MPKLQNARSSSPKSATPPAVPSETAAVSPSSRETATPPGSGGPGGNSLLDLMDLDGLAPEAIAEIRACFPRLLELLSTFRPEDDAHALPKLRIRALRDGFRRAGVAHDRQGRDVELDAFTGAEIEAMLNEPMLTVELV